jgi:hypothetical protein
MADYGHDLLFGSFITPTDSASRHGEGTSREGIPSPAVGVRLGSLARSGHAPGKRGRWRSRAHRNQRSRPQIYTIFQRQVTSAEKQADWREGGRRGPFWGIGGRTSAGMMR